MGSIIARLLLFLSSYFPLALIFFLILIENERWIAVGILTIGVIGLIGMSVYLKMAYSLGPMQIKVATIQRRDGEAMSYIVTYVIPFLSIPFGGWKQGVALSIFFIVLGILYVNSNMIHINPMLNLAGFHIYEIVLDDGSIHSLLTKRRIVRGEELRVIKIGEDIFLEKAI